MRAISKLLVIINTVLLVLLAVLMSISNVFKSSTRLNSALDKSGVYSAISKSVQGNFQTNLDQAGVTDPLVMSSVEKVITPAQIQKLLQPTIISIVGWLNNADPAAGLPQSSIDLTSVKSDLNAQFAKDLDSAKASALSFEVTKAIPDSINLTPGAQIKDSPEANNVEAQSSAANEKTLSDIKNTYNSIASWFWPMTLASVCIIILLFVLNIRRGRGKLTKIAWSFLVAGLITLALGYGSPILAGGKSDGQEMSQTLIAMVPALLEDTKFIGLIYLLVAIVLMVVAFVTIRPTGKKKH